MRAQDRKSLLILVAQRASPIIYKSVARPSKLLFTTTLHRSPPMDHIDDVNNERTQAVLNCFAK